MGERSRVDLSNLSGGAANDYFADAMKKVLANIEDINTPAKAVRGITLTLKIKPSEDRLTAETEINGGKTYTACNLERVDAEPMAKTLELNTVSGFCDYVNKILPVDGKGYACYYASISGVNSVCLISTIDSDSERRRERLCIAELDRNLAQFPFGDWLSQEEFIIKLLSLMQKTDDQTYLLSYVSGIRNDSAVTTTDDGITQKVEMKSGLSGALVDEKTTKPIVSLKPFRTFREVDQPESKFLFRVRKNHDGESRFALFEADGGAWRAAAMEKIKDYIKEHVTNKEFVVLA